MRRRIVAILVVLGLMALAFWAGRWSESRSMTEADVKTIGQAYLDAHAPEWKAEYSLPSMVIDRGTYWEYTFQLPPQMLGGTPGIYIDKQSRQVTKMFHTQ